MIAKPLTHWLVCVSAVLMTANAAQAQGLFGLPFFAPDQPQPRYVSPATMSPCGPAGCPTTRNYGYAASGYCPSGNCGSTGYRSTTYSVPRGHGMSTGACPVCGCSTGARASGACAANCANGHCDPRVCPNGNCGVRTMPYGNGYPSQTMPLPMPAAPSRGYDTNRPSYYYDELPTRVTPPSYRNPRDDYFYGAGRNDQFETTSVDRPRTRFETDRSPFYP